MYEIHIYRKRIEDIYEDTHIVVFKCTTFEEAINYTSEHDKDVKKNERYVIVKIKY